MLALVAATAAPQLLQAQISHESLVATVAATGSAIASASAASGAPSTSPATSSTPPISRHDSDNIATPDLTRPDPTRLRATVEKLVSFGTRHSLSARDNPKRGIGAARTWASQEFRQISKQCGGCIAVEAISEHVTGPRAPDGVLIENILAIQRGTGSAGGEPAHIIILAAHIDSRASEPLDFTSDAPGANDNGSGSALVIEAARILSQHQHRATLIYALLSGEEQGLWGGHLLARYAQRKQWHVAAMLNNDIVGGTHGTNGMIVNDRVRIFSEGLRASEDLVAQRIRRRAGGEDDGPSRSLAKAARQIAASASDIGLDVLLVRRPDRLSRGGDHLPSLEAGYAAVRFSVGIEDYDHQHQNIRIENGRKYGDTVDEMDFDYLAKVTRLNIALAKRLANAPPAPRHVTITGAVSSDTTVAWDGQAGVKTGIAGYRIYWRRTDRDDWNKRDSRLAASNTSEIRLPNIIIDDHFFGVSALADDGSESLISFAVPKIRK